MQSGLGPMMENSKGHGFNCVTDLATPWFATRCTRTHRAVLTHIPQSRVTTEITIMARAFPILVSHGDLEGQTMTVINPLARPAHWEIPVHIVTLQEIPSIFT